MNVVSLKISYCIILNFSLKSLMASLWHIGIISKTTLVLWSHY